MSTLDDLHYPSLTYNPKLEQETWVKYGPRDNNK